MKKESKDVSAVEKSNKKKSKFTRIFVLVLIFAVAVITAFVVSDLFFSEENAKESEPEVVAVCVTSNGLILDDGREVTLEELRAHMQSLKSAGKPFVGSIINDMANPADVTLYNQVVDLFSEFGIICEKLPVPASYDEATIDEVTGSEPIAA